MSSKEIRAGKAFVEVSIRDKLTQGLRTAWGKLKAFAGMVRAAFSAVIGGIAAVGAVIGAVVAPLVAVTKRFADVGSELHDMAGRTGVAVETLSEMKYAAEQTGASLSDVETALRMMAKKGIPVEKFEELAKAISAVEDPSERAAMAMQVFGKSGTKLLPMLREWDSLRSKANSLGLVITTDDAERADALGDAYDDLGKTWDSLKVKAGASFAGPMTRAIEALTSFVVTLGRTMQYAASSIAILGAGMGSVGAKAESLVGSLVNRLGGGMLKGAAGMMGAGARSLATGKGAANKLHPGMEQQYRQLTRAIQGGSFGTFSSPGSGLAGRAGQGIKRDDGMTKAIVAALEKLGVKLDTLEEINEGIEDLDLAVFEN
jgi:hypothetical protein